MQQSRDSACSPALNEIKGSGYVRACVSLCVSFPYSCHYCSIACKFEVCPHQIVCVCAPLLSRYDEMSNSLPPSLYRVCWIGQMVRECVGMCTRTVCVWVSLPGLTVLSSCLLCVHTACVYISCHQPMSTPPASQTELIPQRPCCDLDEPS